MPRHNPYDFNFDSMLRGMQETESKVKNNFLNYREEGSYRMRILPPVAEKELPYFKKALHWIDREPIDCLDQNNTDYRSCPLCVVARDAYNLGDKEKGGKFRKKFRYLFRVLDRRDESEPMFLDVPKTVFDSLFELMTDREWNILDPLNGRDITLTKKGTGLHTKYAVKASPNKSPIFTDTDSVYDLLDTKATKLNYKDTITLKSYDEVLALVNEE